MASVAGPSPNEVLSHAVQALSFGWYKPDEILNLSVKRVTQGQIYDNLNQPIAGGLYDTAMGPIEKHDHCITCGLNSADCLGHMGHIELSLPVYHPLLFDLLYKLVKAKCFVCHRFRCSRLKLKLLLTKLRLLDAGLLLLAKSVDDLALKSFVIGKDDADGGKKSRSASAKKKKKDEEKKGDSGDDNDEEEEESTPLEDQSDAVKTRLDELLRIAEHNIRKFGRVAERKPTDGKKAGKKAPLETGVSREPTSHELTYRREVVSAFFHEIQSKKCHSCGGFSPALRRDGHTKMFRLPLPRVQAQAMSLLNLQFDDVLSLTETGVEKGSEAWKKLMSERNFYKEYQAILRKKKEQRRAESKAAKTRKDKRRDKKNESSKAKANDEIDEDEEDADDAAESDNEMKDDEGSDASPDELDSDSDAESEADAPAGATDSATAEELGASGLKGKKGEGVTAVVATPAKKKGGRKAKESSATAIDEEEEEDDGKKVVIKVAGEDGEDDKTPVLLFPTEVEKHMELLWSQEHDVLSSLWGSMCDLLQDEEEGASTAAARAASKSHAVAPANTHRMFFLRVLAVPPSRFRPPTRFGDMLVDHPQNVYFKHILDLDAKLQKMQRGEAIPKFEKRNPPARTKKQRDDEAAAAAAASEEKAPLDLNVLITTWLNLQLEVNMLLDSTKGNPVGAHQVVTAGIRQTFEKKEGLFRRNMMGKRVNFAARSVISPDPFINVDEVGVPELFATQLSYPEAVTPFNVATLRQAVINGPKVHPGANFVEDERGNLIDLAERSYAQRVALSKTLLTTGLYDSARAKGRNAGKQNGAMVSQKRVLRHVRNGDAMIVNRQPSLHRPSMMTHVVRVMRSSNSRGASTKTQFKNAMWQTIRMHYANCNAFNADFDGDEMNLHVPQNELARAEAMFVSNADNQYVVPTDGSPLRGLIQDNVLTGVLLTKLDTFLSRGEYQQLLYSALQISPTLKLRTPIPTILKPAPLWSGKQVLRGVLDILTADRPPLNLQSKSKVPASSWAQHSEEGVVIIRNNELLCGVLDKSQFGDAGYGLVHAVYELYGGQTSGQLMSTLGRLFTLYLQSQAFTCGIDDMLLTPAAEARRAQLRKEAEGAGLKASCQFVEIEYDASRPREVHRLLAEKIKQDKNNSARLDGVMKSALNPYTSSIIQACLPKGQVKAFPANNMSVMTLSGAKGSSVNFSQISCLLGQQELEGRRVPMMATGKTLPSYRKYDTSPRAGGYVADRFLTGIKPQEYFHHCMAGREGLIDTAVKTSRSGYLQRCLIKHLESLVVNYDYTVRDADGSVIQFNYGEDSIDVCKSSYLDRFSFLTTNYKALVHKLNPAAGLNKLDIHSADAYLATQDEYARKQKNKLGKSEKAVLDPVLSLYNPGRFLGSLSENYAQAMQEYVSKDPDAVFRPPPFAQGAAAGGMTEEKFKALMKLHYISCLVSPGESVGILAGQSIGEPSTQMTLNTFHLAGHGGANVTLGIPRLREIIMTASATLKTPIMEVPLAAGLTRADAERIASTLNRLTLTSFISNATCRESMAVHSAGASTRLYTIRLNVLPMLHESVRSNNLHFEDFKRCFERSFCVQLNAAVTKQVKNLAKGHAGTPVIVQKGGRAGTDREEEGGGGAGRSELDAVSARLKAKHSEHASYDEPDAEDEQAIAAMEAKQRSADGGNDSEDEIDRPAEATSAKAKAKAAKAKAAADAAATEGDAAEPEDVPTDSFNVLQRCGFLSSVAYDPAQQWLECVVQVSLSVPKLLMMSMVENVLPTVLLRATPRIAKSFVVEKFKGGGNGGDGSKEVLVQTEGVNFPELYRHQHLFDVTRIASNDIAAILRTYGVEAARAAIVREVTAVFKVYGISIDPRHLGLVADYMTFHGGFRPLNRAGIDANPSPFQKISFETSIGFLINACLFGDKDFMSSPSSRIVMGRPVGCGTGSFDLLNPLPNFA